MDKLEGRGTKLPGDLTGIDKELQSSRPDFLYHMVNFVMIDRAELVDLECVAWRQQVPESNCLDFVDRRHRIGSIIAH